MVAAIFLLGIGCSNEGGRKAHGIGGPYLDEKAAVVGRAFIALPVDDERVLLSWRLLPEDAPDVVFRVYRMIRKNGGAHLVGETAHTSLIDGPILFGSAGQYELRIAVRGTETKVAEGTIWENSEGARDEYSRVIIDIGENYRQARIACGDLNGDGDLEFVLQYSNAFLLDPAQRILKVGKSEDTIKVAAFLKTGERLWKKDLGWGIEAGAVYSPMVVWDIDNDGRAEVILKTNPSSDPLNYSNEKLTILDGLSGKTLRATDWPSPTGLEGRDKSKDGMGETYNSLSRNYLAVVHLDGKNASIIAARGLYLAQKIVAYDKELNVQWQRFNGLDIYNPTRRIWELDHKVERIKAKWIKDKNRASHSLPVIDIDGDGREEILWGETCIGDGGRVLWRIRERMPYSGHPDIVFPADIVPENEGIEVFYCREGWAKADDKIGMAVFDRQGKPIWGKWGHTHVDGGWVGKVIPGSKGLQCFGYDIEDKIFERGTVTRQKVSGYLWGSDGTLIRKVDESWVGSFPVDWDGDGIREICLRDGRIVNHKGNTVATVRGTPLWAGDIYGDHREEIAVMVEGSNKVYFYFNPKELRAGSKLAGIADRRYRNDLSRTAMQFNVVPMAR